MPGIVCSVFNPADANAQRNWQLGLELLRHHPEHVQETFSEPGFHLACVYHPSVCEGPRLLVTEGHVLAVYGNLYDDDLHGADGQALCQALLARFLQGGVTACNTSTAVTTSPCGIAAPGYCIGSVTALAPTAIISTTAPAPCTSPAR